MDGPRCADGFTWWFILSLDGLEGWTAEGNGAGYWLIPLHPISAAWDAKHNEIKLTADQVDSADDIEAAIISITAENTRPGTIILDGRNGAFVFTGDDRSLNLFASNLTIRGENQAIIENCDDGLFFDDFPLQNILVEGVEFICKGHGVVASGSFGHVILSNNIFRAKINGLGMAGASHDWFITGNVIETVGNGIEIAGAQKIVITNNHLSGSTGISLRECSKFQVIENIIHASHQGIMLVQGSWENLIQRNIILGVSHSGIGLESGVKDNFIVTNRVSCASNTSCLTFDATPDVVEMNTIAENLP
ncbi:MAG: hypothetical protein A2136_02110 [Chloroflexi bacterium RBG_16_54_11]|nr:MAG: hypothetical protein A2136_02110 [Chloroflexi bacterium RBG_16_54_11]